MSGQDDETPVRLICGDKEATGILVSFREGVLVVALEADLGPKIAIARLVTDDSFLVERLKKRLEEVRTATKVKLKGESDVKKAALALLACTVRH